MARKPATGRFDTREELCEAVWREYMHSLRNQVEIAKYCRVSPTTVAKILDSGEGSESLFPERVAPKPTDHNEPIETTVGQSDENG